MDGSYTDTDAALTGSTATSAPSSRNGFQRTLYIYSRGPGDAPGNQEIWLCPECQQTEDRGHAPACPVADAMLKARGTGEGER